MQIKIHIESTHRPASRNDIPQTPDFMTEEAGRASGKTLIIIGPLLAVSAFGTLLAVVADKAGWHSDVMHFIAIGLGAAVAALAVALYFRQKRQRRDVNLALDSAEARVDSVVESAMDAIITVDEHQRIVLFNSAAEKVFGYPRSAVRGQALEMLMPARLRNTHSEHIRRFDATGVTSRRMGDQTVLVGSRAGGGEFPLEASISQHREGGRKFFTVILRDVTERVRADAELRRSRDELRELAAAAISVREQEKSRVARELHDELAQALTALKMDVNWLKERLPAGQQPLLSKVESMQDMLDTTVKATRRISSDLRPLMLDDLGLIPAAEWLVNNFTQRSGIECGFSVDPPDLALQDPHATAIFRILQESLTNVARHARASRVDVTLDGSDGELTLRVRDNGCGFAAGDPRKPNSFGLLGLRERAYLLDGEVTVDTAPGRGAVIEVRIPMRQTGAAT